MEITVRQKFTRQAPRKLRLVANQVKKMPLPQALEQLAVIERRSTLVLMKTMKQAIANAINNHGLKFEDLEISTIQVNGGPVYKRVRAASRGRGNEVKKRTSHILVVLKTREEDKKNAKPEVKAAPAQIAAPKAEVKAEKPAVKKVTKVKKA